jgi:hypothetical protein
MIATLHVRRISAIAMIATLHVRRISAIATIAALHVRRNVSDSDEQRFEAHRDDQPRFPWPWRDHNRR